MLRVVDSSEALFQTLIGKISLCYRVQCGLLRVNVKKAGCLSLLGFLATAPHLEIPFR